jgi:hypothetical protein
VVYFSIIIVVYFSITIYKYQKGVKENGKTEKEKMFSSHADDAKSAEKCER